MEDLRDQILQSLNGKKAGAFVVADGGGVIAGTDRARCEAEGLGLSVRKILPEGSIVKQGEVIADFQGNIKNVIMGEDRLIGHISKPSGIATAAHRFIKAAGDRPRIVSGAWKKMPLELKEIIRRAVITGGAFIRISAEPFIYLDKNYIEVFGGIEESVKAVSHLEGYLKVVQLKGKYKDIGAEAEQAVKVGAEILFIDTGDMNDINNVIERIQKMGMRDKVQIAFGGDVNLEEMNMIKALNVDILDIGKAILDAPLLDLKYEVRRIQ